MTKYEVKWTNLDNNSEHKRVFKAKNPDDACGQICMANIDKEIKITSIRLVEK